MADSDKDILITTATGVADVAPTIVFTGANATANDSITVSTLFDGTKATLSFDASTGQLFSLTNTFTGTIFSVNDVSGIPSIEVDDDGQIRLGEFAGNVMIGYATDQNTGKLQVSGPVDIAGNTFITGNTTLTGSTFGGTATTTIFSSSELLTMDGGASAFRISSGSTPAVIVGNQTANGPLIDLRDVGGNSRGQFSVESGTNKTVLTTAPGFKVAGNIEVTGQVTSNITLSTNSQILAPSTGTTAAPEYSFASNTSTGMLHTTTSYINNGETLRFSAGGSLAIDLAKYGASDTDIDGLIDGSTQSGTLMMGPESSHFAIALRENDVTDAFAIISGGGTWNSNNIWDKLLFRVLANGTTTIGGATTVQGAITVQGNVSLENSRVVQFGDTGGIVSTSNSLTYLSSGSLSNNGGPNVIMYGDNNADGGLAGDIIFRANAESLLRWDESADTWVFFKETDFSSAVNVAGILNVNNDYMNLVSTNPRYTWYVSGSGVDAKRWDMLASGNTMRHRILVDANNAATTYLTVTRSGMTVDTVNVEATTIEANGNLAVTGDITASGYNNANWDTAFGWGDHAAGVASVAASGSVEVVTSGLFTDIFGITVNGVEIMSGSETGADSNVAALAEKVANNINAFTSTPNYTATFSGGLVTITATVTGTGPNGYVVVSDPQNGAATTDTNFSGGASGGAYLSSITGQSIENLSDVNTMTPTDGQVLKWDDGNSRWDAGSDDGISTSRAIAMSIVFG